MSVIQRFKSTVALGIGSFPSMGQGSGRGLFSSMYQPGSTFDWRKYQGKVYDNSGAGLILEFIGRNWGQSQLVSQKQNAYRAWEEADDDETPSLIERPNPWYDGHTLWQATVLSRLAAGNAYWAKLRRGDGRLAFAYMPHNRVRPLTEGGQWIDFYEYRGFDGKTVKVPAEAVVHFRNGMDPEDPRLGVSPWAAQLRQIGMVNLADAYCGSLLHRMGVPGLVISAKGKDWTPDGVKAVGEKVEDKFTVDGAGSTMVVGFESEVKTLDSSPESKALGRLQDIPIARLAGSVGFDPGVLAQPSETSKHHANFEAMIGSAWRQGIIPMQIDFVRTLSHSLDYEPGRRLWFDTSGVAELQEDQAELVTLAMEAWNGGAITRAEVRAKLNPVFSCDPRPDDDVYKSDVAMEEAKATLPEKGGKIAKNRAKRWSDLEDSGQEDD